MMKSFIIILFCCCCVQIGFGQIDSDSTIIAQMYSLDTSFHNPIVKRLNNKYGVKFCCCDEKDNSTIYFHKIWMPSLVDSTGNYYPSHQMVILEQHGVRAKITIHENFTSRVASPRLGWNAFFQTLDSININTLPKHFFELKYALIRSSGGSVAMLRICENGIPKVFSLTENLELVQVYEADMNIYRQSMQKIRRVRKLFKLFTLGLKPK